MTPQRFSITSILILLIGMLAVSELTISSAEAQFNQTRRRNLSSQTLNFANVTSTNVIQNVAETPDNEKEVELGDVDNDGDLDAVVVTARGFTSARVNKLYLNNGGVLTESSNLVTGPPSANGFANPDLSRNVFLRDYDDDGWLDLVIINDIFIGSQAGTTRFFANQHPGGVFTGFDDNTATLNGANGDACGGFSADFDNDGDEDLYFGNYPPSGQDSLYNNNSASFSDVSGTNVPSDSDYTVDVSSADLNGDGKLDLLISNDNDPARIYYNDNEGAGSGVGDFRYTSAGDVQSFSAQSGLYAALEPGDFNGDGLMDVYFANKGPSNGRDIFMINTGNDANNMAMFTEVTVPGIVSTSPTAKIIVSDLNNDGRPELIVMGGDTRNQAAPARRTVIFRNTSVNGQTSFVEWASAVAFPSGINEAGWHAAAADLDGDSKKDILVGGMNDEHMYKYVKTPTVIGASLKGGVLPDFHNGEPLAVRGIVSSAAPTVYSRSIPAGAEVSVVLNSKSGLTLRIMDGPTEIIASDRGGAGVEEAVQFTAPGGSIDFEISLDQPSGQPNQTFLLELLSRTN